MSAVCLRVAQAETHALVGHPTLEHDSGAKRNRSLERNIHSAGAGKGGSPDFGSAARKRPHSVCNRAFETEKTGRDICDVDGIEIAGYARVLPTHTSISDESA